MTLKEPPSFDKKGVWGQPQSTQTKNLSFRFF
jgi:hypothetical protein